MTFRATGTFEVSLQPLTEGARPGAWAPGRMTITITGGKHENLLEYTLPSAEPARPSSAVGR
jgi:hypothetical protein